MPLLSFSTRPASHADAEKAREVANAAAAALPNTDTIGPDQWQMRWTTPNFEPQTDALIAEDPHGQAIGVFESRCFAPYVSHYLWGCVRPNAVRMGVGSAGVAWAAQRAAERFDQAPPDAKIRFTAMAHADNAAAIALLENHGFRYTHSTWEMAIQLSGPPILIPQLPRITIRPANLPVEAETVIRVVEDAFRDHRNHTEQPFEQLLAVWNHWVFQNPRFEPNALIVAEADGQLVGSALCERDADDLTKGYVFDVAVARAYRGCGIGKAMLLACFAFFTDIGYKTVELSVDADSLTGAQRLYQSAGMHVKRRDMWYEKIARDGIDYQHHPSTQS